MTHILFELKKQNHTKNKLVTNLERIKIGETIGGVNKVLSIIGGKGKTGMGIVYICYNSEWKFIIALKTFQSRYFFSNEVIDSFKNEAFSWVKLGIHPYIVRAYTADLFDGNPYISMEYIAPDILGRNTLSHYLHLPVSLERVLKWSIQFCYGMEHTHSQGISCHRDIKPDNIMITNSGNLKITDFGLAKLHSFQGKDEDKIAGTPPWMAPEQFDGIANIKSDIYSFGIVLYQMMNKGKLPFNANTLEGIRKAHKEHPIPEFKSILFNIIDKCLAKEPGDRYLNFKELIYDLETIYRDKIGKDIKLNPEIINTDLFNYDIRGYSFKSLGMYDEALVELEKGRILSMEKGIPDKEQFGSILNNLGGVYKEKKRIDEARETFEESIKYLPENAAPYINLADIHLNTNVSLSRDGKVIIPEWNLIKAKKYLDKALELNPNQAIAWLRLSNYYRLKHDIKNAIKCAEKCVEIKPKTQFAYVNLAFFYNQKKLYKEAISNCLKAIQLNPKDSLTYSLLGEIFALHRQWDKAIEAYAAAYANEPVSLNATRLKTTIKSRDIDQKLPKKLKRSINREECPTCLNKLTKVAETWYCSNCNQFYLKD